MKIKRVIAALLAALITALLFTVGVFAEGESTDGASVEDRTKAYTFNATETELNYRIYYSPAYSSSESDDPAMLILYFHGDGGEGDDNVSQLHSDGLIEKLLSEATERCYQDIPYIIVAPQCPEGESFVGADGVVMGAVRELAAELEATNIVLGKFIVAGVGSGASAAYEYSTGNASKVMRCLAVGGECDGSRTALAISTGVDVFAFAEEGNASAKQLQNAAETMGGEQLTVVYTGSTFDECLANAVSYSEPSLDEWLISDAYFGRSFNISFTMNSDGGTCEAPLSAKYGTYADLVINANVGYIISKVTVNGSEQDTSVFEKSSADSNRYVLRLKNITADQVVSVELQRYTTATSSGELIDNFMRVTAVIAALLVVAAFVTLAVTYVCKYREKKK